MRDADVVIDNYRPGVLAKFGLGHDAPHAVNPAVVTCSFTGYGETGPDAQRAGYDYTIQALAGVKSLAGEPTDRRPRPASPTSTTAGPPPRSACAALVERSCTGVGTHVDLGLFDVQISMLSYLASWQRNRAPPSSHRQLGASVTRPRRTSAPPTATSRCSSATTACGGGSSPRW